jgi:4-alpha-glucanotransferase
LAARINYKYLLRYDNGQQVIEWGDDRFVDVPIAKNLQEVIAVDSWNHAGHYENTFLTCPFTETLLPPLKRKNKKKAMASFTHLFKIKAPLLHKHEVVCITGNGSALGDWHTHKPTLLQKNDNWWEVVLTLPREDLPLQYKYGVYNTKEKNFVRFENGPNRVLFGEDTTDKITVLHDGFIQLPNNTWRAAGISLPVFSLRTKNSFGVGEFDDIQPLADWAGKMGMQLIQILPINDTSATHTWKDSYPYAAISAFALHPLYINLNRVAQSEQAYLIKALKKQQKELNELDKVDYEQVMQIKLSTLQQLYLAQKDNFHANPQFHLFFQQSKHWLLPYAVFCYLRDKNGSSDYTSWKQHSQYNKAAIEKLAAPTTKQYDQIALHYFIQYHLHLQLQEAKNYANQQGVILKGDIPIGIARYSCDAWVQPSLYNIDQQAGAPPDSFAIKGQNWGFPTYNWAAMEDNGFAWWKQRFNEMKKYFDAFRIDHILGFFRIWSIPLYAVEGIMGKFVPALPIHLDEFYLQHIWFDYHRYTQPFITDQVLHEIFGELAAFVKEEYLYTNDNEQLLLKEHFNTQRKVEQYFVKLELNDHNLRLKQGLFDILSNIILIEEEGSNGTQFHYRIAMENTSSFRHLEWGTQQQLKHLYNHYFFERQDCFWKEEALRKLPALKASTNMLVCGEDLGMVPACVPSVMHQLGIVSLEIQRMPKNSTLTFAHPNDAPYLSVVTPATHDMSTLREWWEEDRSLTQYFYNHQLGQRGEAPYYCEPWINRAIVLQHLHAPAMFSIFQLQDILGTSDTLRRENPYDERINQPANPNHYWRYRMHITLEQLLKEKVFNAEWKSYITASGRG